MTAIQVTKDFMNTYKEYLDFYGYLDDKDVDDFCNAFGNRNLIPKVKRILERKGYKIFE